MCQCATLCCEQAGGPSGKGAVSDVGLRYAKSRDRVPLLSAKAFGMRTPPSKTPHRYPSGWYAMLLPEEVRRNRVIRIERFGRLWAAWRDSEGVVRILSDRCPHRGASLSQGRLQADCLACPFHGFRFDGAGQCVHIPAHGEDGKIPKTMRAQSLQVREQDGYIWTWLGAEEAEGEPEFFQEVKEGFSYRTLVSDWDASLSRCIENQLDYSHLPFNSFC